MRFAKLGAAKNAHDTVFDSKTAVWNRFVQINRDGATETAAFRTRPERIVETEETGSGWANIEIAMRAMPTGGEWHLGFRIGDCGKNILFFLLAFRFPLSGFRNRYNIDFAFAETQSGFDRFYKTGAILWIDCDSVLNDLHPRTQPLDFWIDIDPHNCVIDPNAQITLLLQKLEECARLSFCRD